MKNICGEQDYREGHSCLTNGKNDQEMTKTGGSKKKGLSSY